MAFYNEIFVEKRGVLKHIGSCTGSDTPNYFDKVRNLNDWKTALKDLENNNGFYHHDNTHPFPWKTYKTSDNLIVLCKNKRKWFEFWKPTHQVFVSIDKYDVVDENKCNFIEIKKWFCYDDFYEEYDLVLFNLPTIKR